jgi:hypothetical protein
VSAADWRARLAEHRVARHPGREILERGWSLATVAAEQLADTEARVALGRLLELEACDPEFAEVLKVAGAVSLIAKRAPVRAMLAELLAQGRAPGVVVALHQGGERTRGAALESQNDAAEIRLRSERRLGELTAELPKAKGGAAPGVGRRGKNAVTTSDLIPTLRQRSCGSGRMG